MSKILFIGSHPDDIELSCAGTILRLYPNDEVMCLALSDCGIAKEFNESMDVLGVQSRMLDEYPVRNFHRYRQEILDTLIRVNESFNPDMVFTHSAYERHNDHKIVGSESLRAFRNQTIISYTSVINRLKGNDNYFVKLTNDQMIRKVSALKCYPSQQHRAYFDPSVIFATAQVAGLKCGSEFAEGFEVVKIVQ